MFLQNVTGETFLKPFKNVLKRFVLAGMSQTGRSRFAREQLNTCHT